MQTDLAAYAALSPDTVIDAVEAAGLRCDARVFALNSYENRVFQVGIEDGTPLVAKFYRPGRWSDAQIREEHAYTRELADAELPVVAPLAGRDGETLHLHAGFRYALFTRKGGGAPDVGDADTLHRIGTLLGRIHAVAAAGRFVHRPRLSLAAHFDEPAARLRAGPFVPAALQGELGEVLGRLRARLAPLLGQDWQYLRAQGDCHPGNIVWTRDEGPWFVDFDDCMAAPAVQDLWMLLSGPRAEQQLQLAELLDGYETFRDFDRRELVLVDALRTLRQVHYAGWLAARWEDPAFPRAFPWFGSPGWARDFVTGLGEQLALLETPR